jgi:SNF2 family DNA or RNA helicase
MRRNGLGSIIADEMGLEKTIQVICLIHDGRNEGHIPALVVAPATLLENWKREIRRFAPQLNVHLHRGAGRTGFPDELRQHDVVLTSYDTAVADVSLLRNITWEIIVIDEAQAIKNPSAKRTRQLKTLPRRCAIAMTGTPVENRLRTCGPLPISWFLPCLGIKRNSSVYTPTRLKVLPSLNPSSHQ